MLDSSQTHFISSTHDGLARGSIRWMAIELHNPEGGMDPKHSKQSDVWAYGMTLYVKLYSKHRCAKLTLFIHLFIIGNRNQRAPILTI